MQSEYEKKQQEMMDTARIEQLPSLDSKPQEKSDFKFKIVIVGDGGVGKTSFVKKYISGTYSRIYKATVGVETSVVYLTTNLGETIIVEIWDTAGQEMNSGLSDIFYIDAHGFLVFFDLTSRITHQNVPHWINKALSINDGKPWMPIIVCGNKADLLKERKVKGDLLRKNISKSTQYFDISAHSGYNLEKPLLYAIRHILQRPDLNFATNVSIAPSRIADNQGSQSLLDDLAQAQQANIHDEDFKFN